MNTIRVNMADLNKGYLIQINMENVASQVIRKHHLFAKLCILCQVKTHDPLQKNIVSKKIGGREGHQGVGQTTLIHLQAVGAECPPDIFQVGEGDAITTSLAKHKAVWHKLCLVKYNEKNVPELKNTQQVTVAVQSLPRNRQDHQVVKPV